MGALDDDNKTLRLLPKTLTMIGKDTDSARTGTGGRRMLAVSVKVDYTVTLPAAAAVQTAVAATAISAVATDTTIQAMVADDKKAAAVTLAASKSGAATAALSALALLAATMAAL